MRDLTGLKRELGDGFSVARVLPQAHQRTVGPFVFFDYFGPVDFLPGHGIDVRPHPHIGLATVIAPDVAFRRTIPNPSPVIFQRPSHSSHVLAAHQHSINRP